MVSNFFYYDATGQKQGPVNEQQLKSLAAQGVITPQSPLETDTGHKGQAAQIPGLFAAPAPASPFAAQPGYAAAQFTIDRPSEWYGRAASYDVLINGQKLGKIANGQNVKFSVPAGLVKLEVQSFGMRLIAPVTMSLVAGQEKTAVLRLRKNYQLTSILLCVLGIVPGIIYALTVPAYVIEDGF